MSDPNSNPEEPSETREEILRRAGPYLGIGSTFLASVLVCTGGGWWLDRLIGSSPWLTVIGAFAGIAVGFYLFFRIVLPRGGGSGEWSE